ncbi:serine/threonine-protein kinase pim-2-like [Oratosquilla oratoria]|uniref:serine/threonine-protein kinase pim-2-like n=1 Tax=Oratosquilla oratoria TaxID=337810 RepID=UPI003F761181
MELVLESMSIEDYMMSHGPPEEEVVKRLFRNLGKRVKGCLEVGVSHKDIKAENVLVYRDSVTGDFELKLVDFGCGEFVMGERGTETRVWVWVGCGGRVFSPRPYHSVEPGDLICRRDAFYTEESILKANPPFAYDVPARCRDVLTKCLAKDPGDRPSLEGILSHPWLQSPSKATITMNSERKGQPEGDKRGICNLYLTR